MCPDAHHHHSGERTLADDVREATGEAVANCYQCGKCSAGCPMAEEMDYPSSQVLRMLQLGFPELDEKVLRSTAIWHCLTCDTCHSRCPKSVDLPKIMEFLREEAQKRGKVSRKAYDILSFHKSFLDQVKLTGRLYEMGLITEYKLRTGHMLQDVAVAPKLAARGKLKPLPHNIKGRDAIKRIFNRTRDKEGSK